MIELIKALCFDQSLALWGLSVPALWPHACIKSSECIIGVVSDFLGLQQVIRKMKMSNFLFNKFFLPLPGENEIN